MIGCYEGTVHVKDFSEMLEESRGELKSAVGDQLDGRSVGKTNLFTN